MANLIYLQTLGSTFFKGTYGTVNVIKRRHGAFVRKTANNDPDMDVYYSEFCLAKEAVILWHLQQQQLKNNNEPLMFPQLQCTRHLPVWLFNQNFSMTSGLQMEYVGPSLLTCKESGFLVDPTKILTEIMQGCSFLEKAGVVHLDLKTNNVTLDLEKGLVKLIDFGYSQFVQAPCLANNGIQRLEKLTDTGEETCVVDCDLERGPYDFSCAFSIYKGHVPLIVDDVPFQSGKQFMTRGHGFFPTFCDPTLLCAENLGVAWNMSHEGSKLDVFASGMVVLDSMMSLQPNLESKDENDNLEAMLDFLSEVRGPLNEGEACTLSSTLSCAIERAGRVLEVQEDIQSQLTRIVKRTLGVENNRRLHLEFVYGKNFMTALAGALHPVQHLRDDAHNCLAKLKSEQHKLEIGQKPPPCFHEMDSSMKTYLTENGCTVFSFTVLGAPIVSIVVKQNYMFWCGILPVFFRLSRAKQVKIARLAAKELHKSCCHCRKAHETVWYLALNKEKRLDLQVRKQGPRDPIGQLLSQMY